MCIAQILGHYLLFLVNYRISKLASELGENTILESNSYFDCPINQKSVLPMQVKLSDDVEELYVPV